MRKVVFSLFLLSTFLLNGQSVNSLSSDRPGQALSSSTVGKNVFQLQSGIDFFESSSEFFPSSYVRYGISERFELNTGVILSGNEFANEIASFTLGARFRLNKNSSKTQSSLQLSQDLGSTLRNSQLMYIFSISFSEKLSSTINLGLNLTNDFERNSGIYVFNLSYAINNKIGVFLEPFGTFLESGFQFNIDSGVSYLLNDNLQLDALLGDNNGLFMGAGVTWRIPSKNH